jgi:hypothetical protein
MVWMKASDDEINESKKLTIIYTRNRDRSIRNWKRVEMTKKFSNYFLRVIDE